MQWVKTGAFFLLRVCVVGDGEGCPLTLNNLIQLEFFWLWSVCQMRGLQSET